MGISRGTISKSSFLVRTRITTHYRLNSTSPFIHQLDKSPRSFIFPYMKKDGRSRIHKENKDDKTGPLTVALEIKILTVVKYGLLSDTTVLKVVYKFLKD